MSPSEPKKKSKKWVIFGCAGIALIVGVCVFFIIQNRKSNNNTVMDSFCKYANYFLYGEEDNSSYSEIALEEGQTSYFEDTISLVDNSSFIEKINAYYLDFYDNIIKNDDANNEILKQYIEEYNARFELVIRESKNPLPNTTEIAVYYNTNRKTETEKYLDNIVENYENIESIYDVDYYALVKDWRQAMLELLDKYDNMGCLNDNGVDYECSSRLYDDELDNIQGELSVAIIRMNNLLEKSKSDIAEGVQYIFENLTEDNDDAQ